MANRRQAKKNAAAAVNKEAAKKEVKTTVAEETAEKVTAGNKKNGAVKRNHGA